MSEEGPKLYTNKPKKVSLIKAQLKGKEVPSAGTPAATPAGSAAAAAAATYRMGSRSTGGGGPTPPPPPPPKESFAKRYKFLWPVLLTVNLVVGAYLFMRTNKKDSGSEEENASKDKLTPPSSTASTGASLTEKPLPPPTTAETVRPREPIPENQQRDLFKWMLEEKRKLKPKDAEEKKRIDDEKALLKQFIRAKSIPTI